MFNSKYAEASVEILDILDHMNTSDLEKVPDGFINILRKNASKQYISNLDYSKKLNDMKLRKETKELLAFMYEKYWCPEEEKSDLKKRLWENEQKYQQELREKYNPDDIFKNKQEETFIEHTDLTVELEKETFFNKLMSFMKRYSTKLIRPK